MFLVVDNVRVAHEHKELNSAVLRQIKRQGVAITFLTSTAYWQSFSDGVRKDIKFDKLDRGGSGTIGIFRALLLLVRIIFIQKKFKKIIFLSSTPQANLLIVICSIIRLLDLEIFIFLHELSYFNSRNKSQNRASYFFKLAFALVKYSSTNFIIVGPHIERPLSDIFGSLSNNFRFVEHPFSSKVQRIKKRIGKKVNVASIGVQNREKNSRMIEDLYQRTIKVVRNSQIQFFTIGRVEINFNNSLPIIHQGLGSEEYLFSQIQFEKLVLKQHFLVFFADEQYDLKVSGVLFDSIKYEIPLIALRSRITESFFNKFGQIGFLCDDIDGMTQVISEIPHIIRNEEYQEMVSRIRVLKKNVKDDNFNFLADN